MEVVPLATNLDGENNLLQGIRSTLRDADEAIMCVAFAHKAGVNLLEKVLRPLGKQRRVTMLVTTAFGTSTQEALFFANELGIDVRVMNPVRSTYHPKVYVARHVSVR
jgi:HKD family nuclease